MASEVKTNKVSAASGATVTLGNSGDTISVASGATASGFLPSNISTSGDDFQFNSGYGSVATAYGCRAWVNFNGTGTVAIRESGNVSSITDNGTGWYTVNFTTAMPDANYAVNMSCDESASGSGTGLVARGQAVNTTTGKQVQTVNFSATYYDSGNVFISIFR